MQFKSTNDFLESSVLEDREQVLHFVAALPDEKHAPLVIHDTARDGDKPRRNSARAFEIPGWGVVAILDPQSLALSGESGGEEHVEGEMRRVMGLFVSQFRCLIGAPSFVRHQQAERSHKVPLVFLPSVADGIADWELDIMMRARYHGYVVLCLRNELGLMNELVVRLVCSTAPWKLSHPSYNSSMTCLR